MDRREKEDKKLVEQRSSGHPADKNNGHAMQVHNEGFIFSINR